MNRWIDFGIFLVVIVLPLFMTGLLITGQLELGFYLLIHGLLLWALGLLEKLES